jgi:hypothetical protein
MCSSIFGASSGQEGEPPHIGHATAPRLGAPSSSPHPAVKEANRRARSTVVRSLSSAATGGPTQGPRPTRHEPARRLPCAKKPHRRLRQGHVFSGLSQILNVATRGSPAHGPTVPLSTTVTGQTAVVIGTVVGVVIGGLAVIAATGARKQRSNRQSDSGPTCRLASSPEAGPRATIGILNQGYPLLQHEDTAPMRRLLATWRTVPDPTGWAGQRAPRAGKDTTPR